MLISKKLLITLSFLLVVFTFSVPTVSARGNEYDSIVKHLQSKYQAKKVKVPFMWLAKLAVKVVRPAGVKSFSVTMFENLQFSRETLDTEMQSAMRNSLSQDWSPVFRVRSRNSEQAYMYMRESGKDVKVMLVTIDNNQAAVIRATFNPDKLMAFIENPRILGISIGDSDKQAENKSLKFEDVNKSLESSKN